MLKSKNFKFSDALNDRLVELAGELGTDQTDVIREGIRLVSVAVRERRHGNMLAVVSGSTVIHRLIGSWDEIKQPHDAA